MSPTKPRATASQLKAAADRGHLDERTLTGRRAQARTCPTCHARVLVGDDNHLAALTATVDPAPLVLHEEALALAAGRRTYTAAWTAGRAELRHRSQWCHRSRPAPTTDPHEYAHTIHAEHECTAVARISRTTRRKATNNA